MNDRYTKTVLTILAIELAVLIFKPLVEPTAVRAYGQQVADVNIVQVAGHRISGWDASGLGAALPVCLRDHC